MGANSACIVFSGMVTYRLNSILQKLKPGCYLPLIIVNTGGLISVVTGFLFGRVTDRYYGNRFDMFREVQ